jgi:hypothetical protein
MAHAQHVLVHDEDTSSFLDMKMSKALMHSFGPPSAPYRYVGAPGAVVAIMLPVRSPPTQSKAAVSGVPPAGQSSCGASKSLDDSSSYAVPFSAAVSVHLWLKLSHRPPTMHVIRDMESCFNERHCKCMRRARCTPRSHPCFSEWPQSHPHLSHLLRRLHLPCPASHSISMTKG